MKKETLEEAREALLASIQDKAVITTNGEQIKLLEIDSILKVVLEPSAFGIDLVVNGRPVTASFDSDNTSYIVSAGSVRKLPPFLISSETLSVMTELEFQMGLELGYVQGIKDLTKKVAEEISSENKPSSDLNNAKFDGVLN